MLNSKTFCNIPWFEVHINADGTYHTCGTQPMPPQSLFLAKKYNVFNMTIPEWINSEYQCKARLIKLSGKKEILCNMCYYEDEAGSSSKRIKENLKSKIMDGKYFLKSFENSLDKKYFDYSEKNKGLTDFLKPTSYHISLGNECNLACKTCSPTLSSRIASEQSKRGTWKGPIKQNWTTNEKVWNSVVEYICNTENLKFLHLIGGEPLLNPRFEDIVDRLIAAKKTDIYIGFTTNGTIISELLMKKLNLFRHVDIGVSIECMGELNSYIRKGSQTDNVLKNIEFYLKYREPSHVYVTVRPVPSALSVHTLDELYRWCIVREIDVMTNTLYQPEYMQITNLPTKIKNRLLEQYNKWQFSEPLAGWQIKNPRSPERFKEHIDNEIKTVINLLKKENKPLLTDFLYKQLEEWGWFKNKKIKNYFFI